METHFSPRQLEQAANRTSEREIRRCVHCGFCTATCPTYVLLGDELDSPRGRIYLMRDMLENDRAPSAEVVKHIDRCLSCLSCVTTCPSGVNYMHLIDHARSYIESRYRRPWRERWLRALLSRVLPYRGRFRWALRLARIARPVAAPVARAAGWHSLEAMLKLVPSRLPRQARLTPPSRLSPHHHLPRPSHHVLDSQAAAQTSPGSIGARGRVVLLQGCAEPVLRPDIRAAAVRVLERMGVEVATIHGESCCGALVHHLGRETQALEQARRNVDVWIAEIETRRLDAILVTASGCGTMLKNYGFLFADDSIYAEKARRIAALVRDISEFLAERGLPPLQPRVPLPPQAPPPRDALPGQAAAALPLEGRLRVAYHSACSLQHGQGVREPPKTLLTAAGFDVLEPAEVHLCCGSAGTYNLLQPELAGQLRERKLANLAAIRPDVIASGNIGCITQLAAGAGIPVVHSIELLDLATGGPVPRALADASASKGARGIR